MAPRARHGRAALVAMAIGALGAAVAVVAPGPAGAATIAVTTTTDGGPGSLRDAFAQASVAVEPTEIVLQAGATYVLDDCAEGDLAHTGTQPLTLRAAGSTIRQTCPGERVIATDGDLTVLDGTITGGRLAAGIGGGIEADTAHVTLVRTTVIDNRAPIGAGVAAIRVELVASTVSGNDAGAVGGGVWADQLANVVNSTVAGNGAGSSGGGIAVVNDEVRLLHATVAGNAAPVGANIELQQGSDALSSFASVVAEPGGGGDDCSVDAGAITVSQGYSVSSDASCGFGAGPGDVGGGVDVELAPLAAAGGPTATRVPRPASPLIDRVECDAGPAPVPTDQRGVVRPQGPACDIGAVEVEVVVPPSTTGPPTTDPPPAPPATPVPGSARFTG